ncbi:MAG: sulfur transferase domain-containing protein [Planctomycetota bacterium]
MNARQLAPIGFLALFTLVGCQSAPRVDLSTPPVRYAEPLAQAPVVDGAKLDGFEGSYYEADRLIVGSQPSRTDLAAMRERGVGTVINLRSNAEMGDRKRVDYDMAAEAERLGLTYVHIPLGGKDGYEPADVDASAQALEACDGDALVHCASGGRARSMWSAYLIREKGWTPEEAERLRRTLGARPSSLEQLLGEG